MGFQLHQKVQHLHDPSRIGTIEAIGKSFAGEQYYGVFWGGSLGSQQVGEKNLRAYTPTASPTQSLVKGVLGGYSDLQRIITLQRILRDKPLQNNVYAFNTSRTRFFPYQFKPLLKFLASPRSRLLICDEVGLGKTIEAGLILLELRARQLLRRLLIVCPSNLRNKWQAELRNRFGEEFQILDTKALGKFLDSYAEDPDKARICGIASLETLRSPQVRGLLTAVGPAMDLLIFDEAHHLRNFGTLQRDVAATLCASAHAVVMLTATPIQLRDENLYSLLNLLDEQDFPSMAVARDRFDANEHIVRAQSALRKRPANLFEASVYLKLAETTATGARRKALEAVGESITHLIPPDDSDVEPLARHVLIDLERNVAQLNLLSGILTRTRKRDVQVDAPVRRAESIRFTLNPAERKFYDAASEAIRREAAQLSDSERGHALQLLMPQRRLASSIAGMVEYYREEASDDDAERSETLDELVTRTPLASEQSVDELKGTLAALANVWSGTTPDSKYDAFVGLLRELATVDRAYKLVVFATFKHTLRYLERRLRTDGFGAVCISGDVLDMNERTRIIERFRVDPSTQILLSSRVGTEGLDFQFCSVLVNYDLPWNPMEVEQRIGRLDRIGQQAKTIVIYNFWTADTIEERILYRLYDRIGLFSRSIGELETVLGGVVNSLQSQMLTATLSPAEAEKESIRVADVVDRQAKELESLEASAAQFVGADSFFEEEVNAIRTKRRYVTGEQLRRFVVEFLRMKAPRARLEYDEDTQQGVLYPDAEVLRLLRRGTKAGDATAILSAADSGVAITFDAETAYRMPRLEFINVLHPLVQMIATSYSMELPAATAQHVRLSTTKVPPGFYFYVVYRAGIRSARTYNSLEAIFLSDDLSTVIDGEAAEILLGELVERGQSPLEPIEFDPELAETAVNAAERAFHARLETLVGVEEQVNSAFVDQRLESVRAFHEKAIARTKLLLDDALLKRRQERYVRMLRGQIANRGAEMARTEDDLDQLRTVASEYVSISAGVLEVA